MESVWGMRYVLQKKMANIIFNPCLLYTSTPGEINDYLLYLIHEKNISSCQQNQRINAIK